MNLIDDLKWRHATKRMDGSPIAQEKIDRILEAIRLAPTSLGLQAFKVIVVKDQALREKIFEKACTQKPVIEGSHFFVFAVPEQITDAMLDSYLAYSAEVRGLGKDWIDSYKGKIQFFVDKNKDQIVHWLTHQAYIALGVACIAAANEKVDSVPMEGFDQQELDKVLNLKDKGLTSVVTFALGKSDTANDSMANVPKVRKERKDLFEII